MELLSQQLAALSERLEDKEALDIALSRLSSVYPFSEYEYTLSVLLAQSKLEFEEYLELRDAYINRNLYLPLFEITSPRGFGDTWAFGHLITLEPLLKRPTKNTDPNYSGEYDLYLDWEQTPNDTRYIKLEVKASRANDKDRNDTPLYIKALSSNTTRPFLMNFQQLKPNCCDVFIWIAVYRDAIKYWVINANDIQQNPNFAPQHRNESTHTREKDYARASIFEGQIMMTANNIANFDEYLASAQQLKDKIITQYKMQHRLA